MPRLKTPCDNCGMLVECVLLTAVPGGRQPGREAVTLALCEPCLVTKASPNIDPAPSPLRRCCERCGVLTDCTAVQRQCVTTRTRATLTT